MASNRSITRAGGKRANGAARSEKSDEGADDDATVVSAVKEFLAAQTRCARTNAEASFGASLAISPSLLGYDLARLAREDAFSRLRKLRASGLRGLAAKRMVLLTLLSFLGSDDPKIFEYATELVEEYHAALVAVWRADNATAPVPHLMWIDSSLESLPQSGDAPESSPASG